MLWMALLIVLAAVMFLAIFIVLNFAAARRAGAGNSSSARDFSLAGAWLSIIGLSLFIVGFILGILMFHSGGGSDALGSLVGNPQGVAQMIAANPELLEMAAV